ncbi:DUF4124 domain-containing protein [Entomomonas asaccharolytica]|uniref:DUF4124 domain-containing protein n=1 Tax=Entomomonas asaccharolytica TaxID=2785331 RepID=A0A974NEG6_9GAMM|nr:DUF4124 domain-containing protein [Entomomonas asaccharolytica]QQP85135.1 DUF4124 domain-containing protein [Entomomonas asaccharolytica]
MKRIYYYLLFLLSFTITAEPAIHYCVDAQGQRIFSDKPCSETMMGEGGVTSYEQGTVELQKIPVVVDDMVAERIRYRMSPAQIRKKYCAKYDQVQRNQLVQTKQVVLGMYLADVIKVWGAPISSDGNKVLFQDDNNEMVTISLLEGCVINIQHDNMDSDETFFYDEQPIEDNIN